MHTRTDFPRTVRTVEHLWIPLADGCRLAARLWIPEDAEADPVPAVLDAVPYRKGDGTAAWDPSWMTYFAGHGYAGVRIDLRGSGDADGLIADEYSRQEAADVDEVIAWLAEQSWCSGAVGMIGVSWGGFAALQAAARRPPALKAIVPIHASDDRYADDVHYFGGCVLATDMLHWSTCMAAYVRPAARPGRGRRGLARPWRERLDAMEPWVATWLAHQRRDEYWRQGSACEHHAEIDMPGARGRRLVRRLPRHGPAHGRARRRAGARADRPVGAHRAGVRRARARRSASCRRSSASSTTRSRAPRTASSTSRRW